MDMCCKELNEIFIKYGAVHFSRVNFGYCMTGSNEVVYKTALARAKQACSMAEDKETAYCRWDSSNGKEFERKISIENSIRSEIDNNRFFLEYQPIVDAKTNKIVGAEVLARLSSSKEGILAPHYFLPAVNSADINWKFDYYIFEKNCKWIASDKENRMNYVYTINFSRHTLCDPNFAARIMEIVEKYGISYSCIAVELMEDFSLDGPEKTTMIQNVVTLKKKGVMILLDDFGKGCTSFEDLLELDINIVKIDKSITRNSTNQAGLVILKNIIRTVQDLGFQVLCEGIETEEEKNTASNAGCDLFQGFYLYRPMPASQLEKLLEKDGTLCS
jgi:EAL domain-containing protein (putative c-di-GMP-specific phosphodiesterase class I)